jgi:ABC-type glutathione transport system ATPase component
MTGVPLLDVKDLTVQFATRRGTVTAVRSVNVQVGKGETVGIVGESGSGKIRHLLRGDAHSRPRRQDRRWHDHLLRHRRRQASNDQMEICAAAKSR